MFLKKIDSFLGPCLACLLPRQRPRQTGLYSGPIRSLLVIRPGGIGDAILLIPVLFNLRSTFPSVQIEVLSEKRNSEAFALCPAVDKVLCYDRPQELWKVLRSRYDVVIDSEQWYRLSAILARMVRSHICIGYGTNERKRMFTHPVDYNRDAYEQAVFFDLLKPLALPSQVESLHRFLSVPAADQGRADEFLKPVDGTRFIALFPGASVSEKNWGVEKFHALTMKLHEAGHAVVVIGGKEDVSHAAIISGTATINLTGKTSLLETAGILNRCCLLISCDSGVLHMGVGLGKSTVSIFGPSNTNKWAPRGDMHIVIKHHLSCSPCSHFGITPPCPIGVQCIKNVSVDEVFTAAQKLLNAKKDIEGHNAF